MLVCETSAVASSLCPCELDHFLHNSKLQNKYLGAVNLPQNTLAVIVIRVDLIITNVVASLIEPKIEQLAKAL